MGITTKVLLRLSAATVATVFSGTLYAQENKSAERPSNDGSAGSEIIVTAQLRSQSLQDVPAAITALDTGMLVSRGVTNLAQITQLAPALRIHSLRSQTFIFLRGVGQPLAEPFADPQVAVNVNGIYVPSEMSNTAFFDVERIEVVPGPQGTLYGRNATGGVVNLFTRRPGQDISANGFVEVGNYDRVNALVAADVPLTGDLAIRAAVMLTRHDGYFTNGMAGQETYGGRLTAVWQPDDATTITAIGAYVHDSGLPETAILRPSRTGNPRFLSFDPDDIDAHSDTTATIVSLEINRNLDEGVTLTYLGGYNYLNAHVVTSFYPLPVGNTDVPIRIVNEQGNRSTSHEVRLNFSNDRFDAVLGAYYFWNKSPYSVLALPNTYREMIAKSEGEAAFGQITYLVADNLRLTGGLRYSHTKKSLDGSNQNPTLMTVLPFIGEVSENRLDWRAGIEFDAGSDSMLYTNLQTGFTPGGFSAGNAAVGTTQAAPFDTIELLAYSAGMKNRLFDNRLTLNVEGFYYDYKNYQFNLRNPATLQNAVYNAQKARIYGAEVDADFRITPADRITIGAVYLNAKATEFVLPAPILGPGGVLLTDLSGFDLPRAPKWTINASYEHIFNLASGAEISARVDSQFASGQWLLFNHPPNTRWKSHITTDFTLTYRPVNDRWSISAWIRNIEDTLIIQNGAAPAINAPPYPALFGYGAPRTYGGRISFDF